jgi:hypothetical protein
MANKYTKLNTEDVALGLTPELADRLAGAKPPVSMRPGFASSLRMQLMDKAAIGANKKETIKENWFMTWNKFFLGFGTSLAVVALVWYATSGSLIPAPKSAIEVLSGEYSVTNASANSFGSLATASGAVAYGQGGDASRQESGTNAAAAPSTSFAAGGAGGMGGGGDAKMILPYPQYNYKFDYTGGTLPELSAEQQVFKRNKGLASNPSGTILNSIKLGLLNIQKLVSPSIENIMVSENRENGYSVNLNFAEGSMSLYENWRMWRSPERECRDEACFNQYRLKISDLPSDEAVIAVTDNFLTDYGISKDRYGAPMVQDYWRVEYERAVDKSTAYIPDVISVVYPFIIDNKPVFDEGGMPAGLNVSVNVRKMLVSGVGEITTQQYTASPYAGFTDQTAIIALAEKGGFRNYYGYAGQPEGKTVTVELGAPKVSMLRYWKYDNYGMGDELYVPALIFPVLNKEKSGYFRNNVVVPLVKEIINADTQPPVHILDTPAATEPATSEPAVRIMQ